MPLDHDAHDRDPRDRTTPRPALLAGVGAVWGSGLLAGLGLFGGPSAPAAKAALPSKPAAQVVSSTAAGGRLPHHLVKRMERLPAIARHAAHAGKARRPARHPSGRGLPRPRK